MNVKRSVELALLGRSLRDEPYATVPRVSTPSKEKSDVSVKMDFGSVASRTVMMDRLCEGWQESQSVCLKYQIVDVQDSSP